MKGVVKNLTTGRYFESGQMLNHDCLFHKKIIPQQIVAFTTVNVLYFDRETFRSILDQFPDISEDMARIIDEKEAYLVNKKFLEATIVNDDIKTQFIEMYN